MINTYLKYKTKFLVDHEISNIDIKYSKKILFSLFTRFGDTVIDLVVIKEFITKYPEKEYLFLCPRQMKPYVEEILPGYDCLALNKRNLFDMIKANFKLKNWEPDIGFNPWSSGLDSCYFLTYSKKYLCYRNFKKPKEINHYSVIRMYLHLAKKEWSINLVPLKNNYSKLLICPHSTDPDRTLNDEMINEIIADLKNKYSGVHITVASMYGLNLPYDCEEFIFQKTPSSSKKFIRVIKQSDLVICPDSAPLHIAKALNKDVLLYLKNTIPEIILNSGSTLAVENF